VDITKTCVNISNDRHDIALETVYGFDSFNGLPESWRPGYEQGAFAQSQKIVVPGAEIAIGLFVETLPIFVEAHNDEQIGLLHVDCDLYSSTKTGFDILQPLIKPGTVILFDEYFNYPGWQSHEHKALMEYSVKCRIGFEYIAYVETIQQVAIIIDSVGLSNADRFWNIINKLNYFKRCR